MKKILVVSHCPYRGNTTGLTGEFLSILDKLNKEEFRICLFDTDFYDLTHNGNNYPVYHYYNLRKWRIDNFLLKVPGLRTLYGNYLTLKMFNEILCSEHFGVVVLYPVHKYSDKLVKIAHKFESKVILIPWGSEVLRVKGLQLKRLKKAFDTSDFVVGKQDGNIVEAAKNIFGVSGDKIRTMTHELPIKGVKNIQNIEGKLSREKMSNLLGIPISSYNIVCGYNGYAGQRHRDIISALAQNIDCLPVGYQIIFPVTYGASVGYVDEMKSNCNRIGLKAIFLTKYLSDEQVACLHLITDLFIEIQPTDNGNMFMVEALYAKNLIVTGRWLNYKLFEKYGIPYHLIDKPDDLQQMLFRIFKKEVVAPVIPKELIDNISTSANEDNSYFWEILLKEIY